MTKNDANFDDWFDTLQMLLSDEGISFQDRESVQEDYNNGMDVHDVVEEIKDDYEA